MALLNEAQQNVLITGGSGFIGSHLAEYHLKNGDNVTVIDNLSTGLIGNLEECLKNTNFNFIQDDMLWCENFKDLVKWSTRIYHLASSVGNFFVLKHPYLTLQNNIKTCQWLLHNIAKYNRSTRTVIASSSEVYGNSPAKRSAENDTLFIDPPHKSRSQYAISKLTNESNALSYCNEFKLAITVTRIFNTIGPKQTGAYGMVVPQFIQAALTNQPLLVTGDGKQSRSFCNAHDTVAMLSQTADEKSLIGKIINIGNDEETTIMNLAKTIINLCKSQSKIIPTSHKNFYGENYIEIKRRCPDLTLLYKHIKYRPQWDLEMSLSDLILNFTSTNEN